MAPPNTKIILLYSLLLSLTGAQERGPCDPLVPQYCMLPFPNSYYTRQWPVGANGTHTGLKVDIPTIGTPVDTLGRYIHTDHWNTLDGFTLFPSIITYFPDLSSSNLPPHWDIKRSLSLDSPTLIYNINKKELVPHFAELDISAEFADLTKQALMLWPSQSLTADNNYVVILRYLRSKNGSLIEPSYAFKSLRDGIATHNIDIEYRRTYFNEIFDLLDDKYGIKRGDIQLLWDFPTASTQSLTDRLVFMRDDAINRIEAVPPSLNIVNYTDNYSDQIFRYIYAETSVPDYLISPFPGSHLVINSETGLPVYQRNSVLSFIVLIPHSVSNGSVPNPSLVQFGHGLFNDKTEVEQDYLQKQANTYGYILFSCTLWGLANYDIPSIVLELILEDVSNFRVLPDRLGQGVVNELVLMRLMTGAYSSHPLLLVDGRKVIDQKRVHYYGLSLGGVMGVVYMALTNDVERGVLGVAGGSFGLILPRSMDFTKNFAFIRGLYPDPVDFIIMMSMINMIWARGGPSGFMSHVTNNTLHNTIEHQILYQYALGDAQVNILGLYTISRSTGALMFADNVKEQYKPDPSSNVILDENLFGFKLINENIMRTTGAVGFDCGAPPEPAGNVPPDASTDTHEIPRRTKLGQQQFDSFIKSGLIINYCNGPCTDCTQPS